MSFDLVITGGDVVDGTGAPRRRADVGVREGRIAAIGDLAGAEAGEVVDAAGRVVAPGFVDVHTHYDAQLFWDDALTPSPLHGVTTVLAGNCGFSIAPLSGRTDDAEYLMRMLARVEGMPLDSLQAGVPWDWASTSEYLERAGRSLGVNAGFMVGHSAIRRAVMGGEATGRPATEDELAAMERLLHDSLEAGGLGFSSSWAKTHNDAEGNMVPSRYAERDEILRLCRVVADHPGTSLEFIPMVGLFEPWANELMAEMSTTAGRPLNWNVLTVSAGNGDDIANKLAAGDVARARGGKVVALTVPMGFGVRMSFRSGFVLDAMPGWEGPMSLPVDEKLALFADPARRARLNELAQGTDNPLRVVANWASMVVFDVVHPDNRAHVGRRIGEIAADEGREPWDVLCDIALRDELHTSFGMPAPKESDEDWKARVAVWRDGRAVIGASDAGAHLDLLASFNYTTILLDEAVRRRGLLPLEEAVHLLTDVPARLYGLRERGRLQEGWHADMVVFDPSTVASDEIAMRVDLPAGAARLYAGSSGIDHVFVNGSAIVRDGELTSARGGTLLRSGQDTETPELD